MTDLRRACALDDLPIGTAVRVELDDVDVAVVRTAEDEIHAIEDLCSHANVALSEGEVDGTTIECWLHGSCFDLRTGQPTGLPATQPVPVFAVEVRDGEVYLGSSVPAHSHS